MSETRYPDIECKECGALGVGRDDKCPDLLCAICTRKYVGVLEIIRMSDDRHVRAADRPAEWPKRCLGDGAYAAFDGFGVWLTAENGLRATDAVYLEPDVYAELVRFWENARPKRDG